MRGRIVSPIGAATASPYAFNWSNVAAGAYSLTAVATDNAGASTTSAPVAITVGAAQAKLYFIHTDHLNTPRLIADDQQRTVWRWDNTDPFGGNPPDENPSGLGVFEFPLRFSGQYADKETGLHYNYFRDYDPSLGRYGQSDPIGLRGGLNTYGYVDGNPIGNTDRYGLRSTCACDQSFIDCLANCVQAYDPFNMLGKTALAALGAPIPKALFNLPQIGSPYISLPSLLGLGRGTAVSGANVLRLIGRGSSAAFLIYGNYLFAVEVMCTAQCVGDSCAY